MARLKRQPRPSDLFWYWINERHNIWLKRQDGAPWPWTNDPILQEYKFTNVFRKLDRVTQDYIRLVAQYSHGYNTQSTIFHTILFRLFNHTATFLNLQGAKAVVEGRWIPKKALSVLEDMRSRGEQVFTGAYIISNGGSTEPKHMLYLEVANEAWMRRKEFTKDILAAGTLEGAAEVLGRLPLVGRFIAYEMVSDLRYSILVNAPDINTWANVGPGAQRGLNRFHGLPATRPFKFNQKSGLLEMMMILCSADDTCVDAHVPRLELRDVEHSLCEFDKYMRVKLGEGRPRSKYHHSVE